MPKLEIFDESFDPDRFQSYELSIQASLSGFSFCVKDVVRNLFVGLASLPIEGTGHINGDWQPEVRSICNAYRWMCGELHRVSICFESPVYTFVPESLFDPNRAKQLLNLVHPMNDMDEVRYNKLPDGTVCIFALPSMLACEWLRANPKVHFLAQAEPLIAYNRFVSGSEAVTISALVAPKISTFALTQHSKLLYSSSQPAETPEDTAYHLLSICKGLGITPNQVPVNLLGFSNSWEQHESILSRYFGGVKPYHSPTNLHYTYQITKHKLRFASLFIQSICE